MAAQRKLSATARGLGYQYKKVRRAVLVRDNHRCRWCGGVATEADHLLPRAEGGASTITNMVASCRPCNARRGAEWINAQRADRDAAPLAAFLRSIIEARPQR